MIVPERLLRRFLVAACLPEAPPAPLLRPTATLAVPHWYVRPWRATHGQSIGIAAREAHNEANLLLFDAQRVNGGAHGDEHGSLLAIRAGDQPGKGEGHGWHED